jgi:hypothetical protein
VPAAPSIVVALGETDAPSTAVELLVEKLDAPALAEREGESPTIAVSSVLSPVALELVSTELSSTRISPSLVEPYALSPYAEPPLVISYYSLS